jgi:hypothetical protein
MAAGAMHITNTSLVTQFAETINCSSLSVVYNSHKDTIAASFAGCTPGVLSTTFGGYTPTRKQQHSSSHQHVSATVTNTTKEKEFTLAHVGPAVADSLTIRSRTVGYLCIVAIYLFTVCFAYSWGPCVWCLCSEIWPTSQRAKGVSICTTTNWTFGIVISQFVPVAQDALGFGLFFIFAFFCVAMMGFTLAMVPETKGVSIDAISQLEPWSICKPGGRSLQQPLLK